MLVPGFYLRIDFSQFMSPERECELLKALAGKGEKREKAIDAMVNDHQRLVVKIAFIFRGRGLEMEDLIQEGNIGLLEAVKRFDLKRGKRFQSFAAVWIFKFMVKAIRDNGKMIRVTPQRQQQISELEKIIKACGAEREFSPEELARKSGYSVKTVNGILHARQVANATLLTGNGKNGDKNDTPIVDRLPDYRQNPEKTLILRDRINQLTRRLEPREVFILGDCYILGNSLTDAGKKLGLGRNGAFLIKEKVLKKIDKARSRTDLV